jgi:hypothetical protein
MKIPIIELFKLALDMLIWHFFYVFSRNHIFDLKARYKWKAHRKDPDDAARGVAPIRQFHKCDESKILPHKRLGLDLI